MHAKHSTTARHASWGRAMDVPAVLEALGADEPDEVAVLLRLLLMAADQVTGEQTLVSSFVKRIAMPPTMIGPDVEVALELLGERRVFKPTCVVWDETYRVCILEIMWVVADHTAVLEEVQPAPSWTI